MQRKKEITTIKIWFVIIIIFLIFIVLNSFYLFIKSINTITNSFIIFISIILIAFTLYSYNLIKTKIFNDNKLLLRLRKYYSTELKRKDKELKEKENKLDLVFKSALKRSEELNQLKLKLNEIQQTKLRRSTKKKTRSRR